MHITMKMILLALMFATIAATENLEERIAATENVEERIAEHGHDVRFWRGIIDKGLRNDPTKLTNEAATYCFRNGFDVPEVAKDPSRERDCVVGILKSVNRRVNRGRRAYVEYLKTLMQKQNVRIAVFENESRHSEVIGMILQNFKNFDIDVFLPPPTRMSFLDVYENMPERFGTFRVLDAANFDDDAAQRYDLVFFNTAQEAWNARVSASTLRSRCVLISHELSSYVALQHAALYVLSLSPVIDTSNFALPVLDLALQSSLLPPPRQGHDKFFEGWMRIAVIGFGNPGKSIEDVVSLVHQIHLKRLPVRVTIISKGTGLSQYLKSSLQKYMRLGIVSWIERCSASQLLRIARLSRFVFTALGDVTSCYRRFRLSGSISLALSLGTPLIIDRTIAMVYGLSNKDSVLYEKFDANAVLSIVMSQSSVDYISMRSHALDLASEYMSISRRLLFHI